MIKERGRLTCPVLQVEDRDLVEGWGKVPHFLSVKEKRGMIKERGRLTCSVLQVDDRYPVEEWGKVPHSSLSKREEG
jgi:hypothetical protein